MGRVGRLMLWCAAAIMAAVFAHAAEAATVRINPTKLRLSISPGQTHPGAIEVTNPSDEPLIVKVYLEDWVYTGLHDGTKIFSPPGTTPLSCAGWIRTSLSDFVLPAFGSQMVQYTVTVPRDASGGRYAVLFFETLLSKPELRDNAEVGVLVRIGALFYIEPAGTIRRSARVSGFSLQRGPEAGPLQLSFSLENTGNVDITAGGTFHLIDKDGVVAARREIANVYTFPGETAGVSSSWNEPIKQGSYDFVLTLDAGRALEGIQAGMETGPVITQEATVQIGASGDVVKVGELK